DIASVHLAAFSSNILLHAQFPTPASLLALREFLRQDTLRDLRDPGKAVLVVRDTKASNLIVGFAKWDLPGHDASHSDITWPEGCREEYLKGYYEKVMAARDRVMGGRHCYCLTYVGTLPDYRGRGVGTMLTEWGLERARADRIPIYLDSTLSASSLYRRLGFVALDGISMTLPGTEDSGEPLIYEELSMLR
ncbi:hypothetical protein M430DRAFT_71885, partial [Amorphotheca resinae ATCC 22711]